MGIERTFFLNNSKEALEYANQNLNSLTLADVEELNIEYGIVFECKDGVVIEAIIAEKEA